MCVERGESELVDRQLSHAFRCGGDGYPAGAHVFEEFPQGVAIHAARIARVNQPLFGGTRDATDR